MAISGIGDLIHIMKFLSTFLEDYIFGLAYQGGTRDTDSAVHVLWRVQRWVKLEKDSHNQSYI